MTTDRIDSWNGETWHGYDTGKYCNRKRHTGTCYSTRIEAESFWTTCVPGDQRNYHQSIGRTDKVHAST